MNPLSYFLVHAFLYSSYGETPGMLSLNGTAHAQRKSLPPNDQNESSCLVVHKFETPYFFAALLGGHGRNLGFDECRRAANERWRACRVRSW